MFGDAVEQPRVRVWHPAGPCSASHPDRSGALDALTPRRIGARPSGGRTPSIGAWRSLARVDQGVSPGPGSRSSSPTCTRRERHAQRGRRRSCLAAARTAGGDDRLGGHIWHRRRRGEGLGVQSLVVSSNAAARRREWRCRRRRRCRSRDVAADDKGARHVGFLPTKKSRVGSVVGCRPESTRPLRSMFIWMSWIRCVG